MFGILYIFTGVPYADELVQFCPNCPYPLYPHDHTVPSDFNACIVFDSDAIATTSVKPFTCINVYFEVAVPSPVVPYPLYPETHTVPSAFNTAVY